MEQKSNGALTSVIIIIIILIAGGIYFWRTSLKNKVAPSNTETPTAEQVTTDNTSDLENDLNNIDVNNVDQGL